MGVQCVLDRSIVNNDTIYKLTNMGLSIFAVLCGKNRGVFVTNDNNSDDIGNTYSCLTLPPSFLNLVSVSVSSNPTISMSTSNDIGTYALCSVFLFCCLWHRVAQCVVWCHIEKLTFQCCVFCVYSAKQTYNSRRGISRVRKRLIY